MLGDVEYLREGFRWVEEVGRVEGRFSFYCGVLEILCIMFFRRIKGIFELYSWGGFW